MDLATSVDADREQRFNAVLLALVKAFEQGRPPDRDAALAAHPEFAAELAEFFAGRDCLARLAPARTGLRGADPGPGPDARPPASAPTRPRRWSTRTSSASSTATSSPPTCCWT